MSFDPIIRQSGIRDVQFGKGVQVVEPVNLYECEIGNDVFVGPFVEIQKNVSIGENCKIQSHSFICELVNIGDNCFIGHGVMFVNDLFSKGGPARGDKNLWKSTKIGNNVSIGHNAIVHGCTIHDNVLIGMGAIIMDDCVIESNSIIAAGAVVTKNTVVPSGTVFGGMPAKKIKEVSKELLEGEINRIANNYIQYASWFKE